MKIHQLSLQPPFGCASKHAQTILSAYMPRGAEPPSSELLVELDGADRLSCMVSVPPGWSAGESSQTIVLVHGLGGSHLSRYMVRLARKLYQRQDKVVRVNLRNCGTGLGLSKLPYCGGNSHDIKKVLLALKAEAPSSPIQLIGFSLGGNIVLKLLGELEASATDLVKCCFAVSPPLDLEQSVQAIERKGNELYHAYYLKNLLRQARAWAPKHIRSLFEFDDKVTAPFWGFSGAKDYYRRCSSGYFLQAIQVNTRILLAADDPFIPVEVLKQFPASADVQAAVTNHGGHMGFLSRATAEYQWLDQLLLEWTKDDFRTT